MLKAEILVAFQQFEPPSLEKRSQTLSPFPASYLLQEFYKET
jgi:hypothetical protein